MSIDLSTLSKVETYRLLTHSVVPRPIAWVLTENTDDTFNLAPFSYFNVACSDPAMLMFSIGHKRDGQKKDTWRNLERSKRCVIHIADSSLVKDVNETARSLAANMPEVDAISASLTQDPSFALPRVETCPVAFDCDLNDIHLIGNGPQAVVYVQVNTAYVADALKLNDDFTFSEEILDPLARLGGDRYSLLGEVITLARPG